MFCKSCGLEIDSDSRFCYDCGAKQFENNNKNNISNSENNNQIRKASKSTEQSDTIIDSKYDLTYKKDEDAFAVSIMLIILFIVAIICLNLFKFESYESLRLFNSVSALVSLIIRFWFTIWVVKIAKQQNREPWSWGIIAFLIPIITLLIISTRKKYFLKIAINANLTNEQNSEIICNKSIYFFDNERYFESLRFAEKALEFNPSNLKAKEIIEKSNNQLTKEKNIKAGLYDYTNIDDIDVPSYSLYRDNKIIFGDGIVGELIKGNDGKYFIVSNTERHYYESIEDASKAAYIYAKTKKIIKNNIVD